MSAIDAFEVALLRFLLADRDGAASADLRFDLAMKRAKVEKHMRYAVAVLRAFRAAGVGA